MAVKLGKEVLVSKLPQAFMGGIIGIVFGGIAGGLFADVGYASSIAWEEVFVFLGAIFGAITGYNLE